MILQALTEYYQSLERQGQISPPGWGQVKVSFALYISMKGQLTDVVSLQSTKAEGKKTVLVPQLITLPAPVKRSSGVSANFLCDHSGYLLGVDNKEKPQRALDCFAACRALHEKILTEVDSPVAEAILSFFRSWQPEQAQEHPALAGYWEEIISGANLIFRTEQGFAHEDAAIRRAWEAFYSAAGDAPQGVCLVTGELGPIESVHPAIKNVAGAQSSGAALVSFNAPAFCSYGKEQNLNAPTGKYAAFAYTTALNHLLADREHVYRLGDASVVCWAKGGGNAYQELFGCCCFGQSAKYNANDLEEMVKQLCQGHSVVFEEALLDPDMDFYILGLSPNAARLSVRFFLHNTFGGFLKNVQAHYDRLKMIRPVYEQFEIPSLKALLDATVNLNSRDKQASPVLVGEMFRAILNNTPYPASLLNGTVLRIRAEHRITWPRASILKAYYLKRPNPDVPKEVLTVSLNPESTSIPYNLGRLFSVLEKIQKVANPEINATIKDKYFNSASATPSHVFPVLLNLAQKHLRKMEKGPRGYYDKLLTSVLDMLGEEYPVRMNLPQQGAFQLGYYHQTQVFYTKKEEN